MTLPASGSISLSQVNTELGLSSTASISLNDSAVRTLFAKSSGAIAMNDGYGKSNTFPFTISSNQTNANLRSLALAAGWNGTTRVVATVGSGVYISSNSTGTPALTVNGSFPNGVELVNSGIIVGMGGNGGKGGGYGSGINGVAGSAAGGALSVSVSLTVTNNNTIAGGGGGGGGSAAYGFVECGVGYSAPSGGGGGGRSSLAANSSGGAGGDWADTHGSAGASGTISGAGAGGAGYFPDYYRGASGGDWGSAGGTGTSHSGYQAASGGAGGAGGYAVSGNGYITWSATGTRYGSIS